MNIVTNEDLTSEIPKHLILPEAGIMIVFSGDGKPKYQDLFDSLDGNIVEEAKEDGCLHYHGYPNGLSIWRKGASKNIHKSRWHQWAVMFSPDIYDGKFIDVCTYTAMEFLVAANDFDETQYSQFQGGESRGIHYDSLDHLISARLGEDHKSTVVIKPLQERPPDGTMLVDPQSFAQATKYADRIQVDGLYTAMSGGIINVNLIDPKGIDDQQMHLCKTFNLADKRRVKLSNASQKARNEIFDSEI